MLVTSPPMDAMLHMRGAVTEEHLGYFGHRAYDAIMERGAKSIVHTIVKDCSTMGEYNPLIMGREFQLDVVVLSRERYADLINAAYKQGLQDRR